MKVIKCLIWMVIISGGMHAQSEIEVYNPLKKWFSSEYKVKWWWLLKAVEGKAGISNFGYYLSCGGLYAGIGYKNFGVASALEVIFPVIEIKQEYRNNTLVDVYEDKEEGGIIPLYLYYIPFWGVTSVEGNAFKGKIPYIFLCVPIYGATTYHEKFFPGFHIGMGLEWFVPLASIGLELGFMNYSFSYYYSYKSYYYYFPSFYLTAKLSLWSGFGSIGKIKKILPPYLEVTAGFEDRDKNKILSRNDEGVLNVEIYNKGKGEARNSVLKVEIKEKEFAEKIDVENPYLNLGNIKPFGKRKISFKLKPKGELVTGKFNVRFVLEYETEFGEKEAEEYYITIRTASLAGMIKVAFTNIEPSGLPSWIIPTIPEYADYEVEYSPPNLSIINLNTGEEKVFKVKDRDEAMNKAKGFFLAWDKEEPQIIYPTGKGRIRARKIRLPLRLVDDRKIEELKIYVNDKLFKTEKFTERTEAEREYVIPLKMGINRIRLVLTDWMNKKTEKELVFTRIRGGEGTFLAGTLPEAEPPPKLVVKAYPSDRNNTIVGGNEEGLVVSVTNKGKGVAKWVRVVLEGDEELVNLWGKERNLEDIKPGETKRAVFSILMPTELKRRKAKIYVTVKEGRGYSPTKKPVFEFTLLPAEKEIVREELIEDVDFDIPEGRIKREKGYALIIGVSKYLNVKGPKYARNDAEIFKKYANKVLGIPERNIKVLLDERATGGLIKARLNDWLKRKKGFKIIFFSGHGAPDPENPREGDVYIVPYDGDPELKSTLISIKKELSKLPYNQGDTLILFLDACYSGGEGKSVQLASKPLTVSKLPETQAIIFASAEGAQPAKEFEKAKHGYFTYYTLLGLKGKADENKDGWITTKELYKYVKEKVSDATNYVQEPVLRPEKEIKLGKIE